jgi:16S rRNA (cytidine1402-2'-O)-methyltransferase
VLAALVAAGLPAAHWSFEGFLPRRGRERREVLARIAGDERATVLFEAPGRTAATLGDLAAACGGDRPAALCRELTKLHEEVRRGPLAELAEWYAGAKLRGEVTLVVAGRHEGGDQPTMGLEQARQEVVRLMGEGMSRSSAAREVARQTGLPRRELFREEGQ